jgi:cell division septation protein DedD
MPNLNVKGDTGKPSSSGGSSGSGGSNKIILYIVMGIAGLALVAFVLNSSGVVKLWGKKKPAPVVVDIPGEDNIQSSTTNAADSSMQATPQEAAVEPAAQPGENLTVVEPKGMPAPIKPRTPNSTKEKHKTAGEISGTGMYTVQISSFTSEEKAQKHAQAFSDAGYPSFVESMGGWYHVCVGRYESRNAAKEQGEKLVPMLENNYAIVKVNK